MTRPPTCVVPKSSCPDRHLTRSVAAICVSTTATTNAAVPRSSSAKTKTVAGLNRPFTSGRHISAVEDV